MAGTVTKRRKPVSRRRLPKLDSVTAQIAETRPLTIDHESCQNVASCGFRGGNLPLAIVATDILLCEKPITLRGLMYQVVSAGWLPSTDRVHYARLGRIMTRLRELSVVPFSWLVDGIRSTDKPSSWSGLADYAKTVRDCYRLDFWARLPHYVHLIVEKDAVAGTLAPVTREYDVALSPIRGYSSLSFAHEIAETWNQIDKPIFCYFLGDFDPSGFDLQRDIRDKLERYSDKVCWFGDGTKDDEKGVEYNAKLDQYLLENMGRGCVHFRRVGVVDRDFDDFNLLPLRIKKTDRRAAKFREEHGDRCAELDAIPSSELRRRVRSIIDAHITNRDEWERLQRIEEAERETLEKTICGLALGGE